MTKIYSKIARDKIDVIGDIHGCFVELTELLEELGYGMDKSKKKILSAPKGRRLVFVGDFTDRGLEPVKVLRLVMDALQRGIAYSVRGNHEEKLLQKLKKNTPAKEEVMATIEAVKAEGSDFVKEVIDFIDRLPYVILCQDTTLVAHAGLKEEFQDFDTDNYKRLGKIKSLTIYGDITGRKLEDGMPERLDWAAHYRGRIAVIYGHSIVENVEWRNNTVNIDTGCFSTGILTAVRMPEREFVQNRMAKGE
jgi:protein phosphatase